MNILNETQKKCRKHAVVHTGKGSCVILASSFANLHVSINRSLYFTTQSAVSFPRFYIYVLVFCIDA